MRQKACERTSQRVYSLWSIQRGLNEIFRVQIAFERVDGVDCVWPILGSLCCSWKCIQSVTVIHIRVFSCVNDLSPRDVWFVCFHTYFTSTEFLSSYSTTADVKGHIKTVTESKMRVSLFLEFPASLWVPVFVIISENQRCANWGHSRYSRSNLQCECIPISSQFVLSRIHRQVKNESASKSQIEINALAQLHLSVRSRAHLLDFIVHRMRSAIQCKAMM